MKQFIILTTVLFCTNILFSQKVDRSKPPEPTKQRAINFGKVNNFTLKNGLQVIVVENHKLPQVRMDLFLDNGSNFEGDKAGYISMFGEIMKAGTKNATKEELDEKIDFLGSDFFFNGFYAGFSSLKKQLIPSLEIFNDVIFNPTLDNTEELEKLKKQQLTSLESEAKNPDAISNNVKGVVLYGKNDPWGEMITPATINNIKIEDFKSLYQEKFVPNNAYLTIVGDITLKEAKKLVKKYFKSWKKSDTFSKSTFPLAKKEDGNKIIFVDLPTATQSSISIIGLNDLKKRNKDYHAAVIGNSILGGGSFGRLFKNIREDKGWTYGAYSTLSDNNERLGNFYAGAKVRNEVTDSAVVEFLKEIKKITLNNPSAEEIATKRAEYNGNFALGLERPQTVARFARTQMIENLPADFYQNYLKNINNASASDIKNALNKYIDAKNLKILIVGKALDVLPSLEKLNIPIEYYNNLGDKVAKPKMAKTVSGDVSAEAIIQKAIAKIGGATKLKAVKSLKTVANANMQGQDIVLIEKKMNPNKSFLSIEVPAFNMTAYKQTFNGKSGSIVEQGATRAIDGKELVALKAKTSIFKELNYANSTAKKSILEIVPINDSEAYKIEFLKGENKTYAYFDVNSGLLVKESRFEKNPTTKEEVVFDTFYSDFKNYQGIMLPTKVIQTLAPGVLLETNIKEVSFNKDVTKADFN